MASQAASPVGMLPLEVLAAGGAIALAVVLLIVVAVLGSRETKRRNRRLQRVKRGSADAAAADKGKVSVKRSTTDSSIATFDRLIKRYLPNPARLRSRLGMTGRKISIGQYLFACFAVAAVAILATRVLLHFPGPASLLVGIVAGLGLPHFAIGAMARRRLRVFVNMFPEAIDLIVRGLKSGLPVTESVRVVGTEIKDPVGAEFRIISDSVKFGMTMNEALWSVAPRLDAPEFRFFIISLAIQQETGGNLAETLENLSGVIRRRRQMKLKIKAFSSEAKASAYIIGSLPFLMLGIILMMNYGYAIQLFTDTRGLMMVGVGLMSYAIGIFVMVKMVRFEI